MLRLLAPLNISADASHGVTMKSNSGEDHLTAKNAKFAKQFLPHPRAPRRDASSLIFRERNALCYKRNQILRKSERHSMASFGLTLANRGVIIGAVTVPQLFDMAKRG